MASAPLAQRLSPLTSQAVFRVVLASLAQPGRIFQLPEVVTEPEVGIGVGAGIIPLALAVIGAKVAIIGSPDWATRICQATGASLAEIAEASLAAIYGPAEPAMISKLRRGSAVAPENGAKVGLDCGTLIADGRGEVTLRCSGPGVPGRIRLGVDGVSSEIFDALREVNAAFPAGVDAWLVDQRGRIAGLPRSTRQVVV
jgi:alpha-D-ribose 1-methylphosphonate 5-triphosphate synthase subunit PhnH